MSTRSIAAFCLCLSALSVTAYVVVVYGFLPLGTRVHPDMEASFVAHRVGIYAHVFASSFALVLGPLQFSARLRKRYTRIHRTIGRGYLAIGVGIGGVSGLYMSAYAFGGSVAKLGFACLAASWLFTGIRAFQAIRRGAISAHREWMIRNYALTFAAVTLRLYLPSSIIAGIPFEVSYPVIAWLAWLPNALIGEWYIRRRQRGCQTESWGNYPGLQ